MAINNLFLASSNAILASLSNTKPLFNQQNAWQIAADNPYIIDTVRTVKRDLDSGGIDEQKLIDYISSGLATHCFNGWAYLSASINSLLDGDFANSIHNAYYAELRSMMSILASQGIGVFNHANVIVDTNGNVHAADTPTQQTHQFAKLAFNELFAAPASATKILELTTYRNVSLKTWVDNSGFPVSQYLANYVSQNWLENWSMDVAILENESNFRNFVSYNPQLFDVSIPFDSDDLQTRLSFVSELWRLCAPDEEFSKAILRITLETYYSNLFPGQANTLTEASLRQHITSVGLDGYDTHANQLIEFLLRRTHPANNIIFEKATSIFCSPPYHEADVEPMGIISRACLLLLLNTKIVESTFRQAQVKKEDLQFWYDHTGVKNGLWDLNDEPTIFSDLWLDVEPGLDEIEQWLISTHPNSTCFKYKRDLKSKITNINQFSRAFLWGIAG